MKEQYSVFYNDYNLGIISEHGAVISSYVDGFDTIIRQAKENISIDKAKKLLVIPDRKENKRTKKNEIITLLEFFHSKRKKSKSTLKIEIEKNRNLTPIAICKKLKINMSDFHGYSKVCNI